MFNEYLEVNTGEDQKITISAQFAKNSKKSILINHGMAEHQRRYKEFINFLIQMVLTYLYMIIEVMVIELPHQSPLVFLQSKMVGI